MLTMNELCILLELDIVLVAAEDSSQNTESSSACNTFLAAVKAFCELRARDCLCARRKTESALAEKKLRRRIHGQSEEELLKINHGAFPWYGFDEMSDVVLKGI